MGVITVSILIKAVYIKPDGVYLYSKNSEDEHLFCESKNDSLTDVYVKEGQQGLDREMVRMFYECAEIRGKHPSVARYYPCLNDWGTSSNIFIQKMRYEFEKLSPEDVESLGFPENRQTTGAKAYKEFRQNSETELYERLAQRADKLSDKKFQHKSDISR